MFYSINENGEKVVSNLLLGSLLNGKIRAIIFSELKNVIYEINY